MKLRPFILAGGRGTRLWPASGPGRPKPLLSLGRGPSLLGEALSRAAALPGAAPAVILAAEEDTDSLRAALRAHAGVEIWTEPEGKNTGPSVAWALHEIEPDSVDEVAVFLPADHAVADQAAFQGAVVLAAAEASRRGEVALLGVRPDRPETGYGYIEAGAPIDSGWAPVLRFVEKPDRAEAERLAARRDVHWNSGLFVIPVRQGLEQVRRVSPSLAKFLYALPPAGTARRAGESGRAALASAFAGVTAAPFDKAVLERLEHCGVVPLDAGWSDLGDWQAVWQAASRDGDGNAVTAGSLALDCAGSLIIGEGCKVAVLGVRDMVVVAWGDRVLVCPRSRAQEVRGLARGMAEPGGDGGD